MKQITRGLTAKSLMTFLLIAFFQTMLVAQESGASESASGSSTTTKTVTVTSQSSDWYTSPWVWVAGAAVFILLLVALLRGRDDVATTASRTDKVTITKTTSDDIV